MSCPSDFKWAVDYRTPIQMSGLVSGSPIDCSVLSATSTTTGYPSGGMVASLGDARPSKTYAGVHLDTPDATSSRNRLLALATPPVNIILGEAHDFFEDITLPPSKTVVASHPQSVANTYPRKPLATSTRSGHQPPGLLFPHNSIFPESLWHWLKFDQYGELCSSLAIGVDFRPMLGAMKGQFLDSLLEYLEPGVVVATENPTIKDLLLTFFSLVAACLWLVLLCALVVVKMICEAPSTLVSGSFETLSSFVG